MLYKITTTNKSCFKTNFMPFSKPKCPSHISRVERRHRGPANKLLSLTEPQLQASLSHPYPPKKGLWALPTLCWDPSAITRQISPCRTVSVDKKNKTLKKCVH